ncbi:hypothetical protein [Gaiella sp.]|uniref:hypothetical protein n=1 Tax=Gaiella sp. TaxID=2663207 RepID=UPI003983343B
MKDRLKSPGFVRALTWVSALVLIAGVAAVGTVWLGGDDSPSASPPTSSEPGQTVDEFGELPPETKPSADDVPAAARKSAAIFIEGAVARRNLAKAWTVTHPDLKRDCDCTLAEWKTGNIPVLFFPALGAGATGFGVNEISPGRIVLEVLLYPKKGAGLNPTAFYLGLKSVGVGDNEKWLVDYFAPIGSPPVPSVG